jgi:hypothetical protein
MIVSFQKAVPMLAAALAGVLATSCSQGEVCKELASCGGSAASLLGTWAQAKGSNNDGKYCQENMHIPPLQDYRQGQPTPVARQRVPENNNLDWCYNLVLAPTMMDPVKKHFYWWENLPYVGGLVTYNENGSYSIDFSREGKVQRHYSETCLTQYGHGSDCTEFQHILEVANEGAREYHTFRCSADAELGGCNCSFFIGEANAQAGIYKVSGNTIKHYPTSQQARYTEASFCVGGDKIDLSGLNNSFLWERQGLRTIELVKVNCEDGKQGPGEAGIDCGLRCPTTCPE